MNHTTPHRPLLRHLALLLAAIALLAAAQPAAHGETLRKRYTFAYDRKTRKASSMLAAKQARKQFLRDYLAEKFSTDITSRYGEDIDMALDPPDQYLTSFEVVSERLNEDESQVTLTVEGQVDLAQMIAALVRNKVLSFGKDAPRVMVLPSSRFEDPKAAKSIRALIFDQIKEAGLRPVAFEGQAESVSVRVESRAKPGETERRALIREAVQYGADYLIYIDAEVETKPFSQGGFIADGNFIYTILRPNGSLMLGEAVVSERGSGSSAMLAFDRALDSVAPVIARNAVGQLYESIFADSDVIQSTPQALGEKTVVIHWAGAPLVQAVVERLQNTGARARLGTGMSDTASRVLIETGMDDFELYGWFNAQSFTVAGKTFKTPVVAYSENVIEVEAVEGPRPPRRSPLAQAPPRKAKPRTPAADSPAQTGPPPGALAKITLRLRPAQFNR